MRDTLLKLAPWIGLAAVAAISMWLWPLNEPAPPAAPSQPPPPPAASSPALSSSPSPSQTATPPLTAAQLTEQAKQQLALNPEAALADIALADKLAGPEPDALNETRRVLEIHALVRLGKVGLARTLTDRFYRTFPNSDRADELERLTGYHPRPTGP
jgi:hypothetical protein